ncbi:MAG: SLBB domain-containing protein, partial [Deltaproteobacteria bacterium]|nr:SLBB domain-containing protein [Deltaproteobacteria bacterium]
LQKDPSENIQLAPLDRIVVYSKWDVQFYPERTVTIRGSVQKPDDYTASEGMRVQDIIFKAGGVMPEAYLDRAEIIRLNEDRKTTTIIPFHLGKALQKDPSENIQLAPLDRIVVYSKWDVQFYPERTVTIRGSVQKPGDYPRSDEMRISDLLVTAGGLMPNVYLERADLLRFDFERETYQIIPVEISRVMEKDKTHDIILNDRDLLHILAKKDAAYTYAHEVDIYGAVQRPGTYKRGEGMSLQDLIFAAGGLLPGAAPDITIAKAGGAGKTITITVKSDLVKKGDPAHNVFLDDVDIVMVREDSEYFERPRWVTLKGEIRFPGAYPMLKRDERISDIIARAGGLTGLANPKGAVYMRRKDFIPSEEQKRDIQIINKLTNSLNDLEYKRQAARNLWLIQKEVGMMTAQSPAISGPQVVSGSGTVSEAAAIALAPSIAQASGKIASDVIGALETGAGMAATARKLEDADLAQSERIVVNLDMALKGDSRDNLQVHEGDSLTIPRRMETVSIVGAVMKPVTLNVNNKWKLKKYITRAGGFAADGDPARVIVSRVDGTVMTADEIDYIEAGDVIFVPTRVISTEIITTADKVISVVKFTLATVASVVVFLALIP